MPNASLSVRPLVLVVTLAALVSGGCSLSARRGGGGGDITGSVPSAPYGEQAARSEIEGLAARYRSTPTDTGNAMRYARALRATGQSVQAVAVLERVAIREPRNLTLMGEFGRALADAGRHDQALQVLGRAHRPDQPDWRIINVQASIYDQMGRPQEAQALYNDALKIAPGEPAILSNLGLSYALSRQLPQAEQALRQAAGHPQADKRVRQNLALVVGLQGRFAEAEEIARKDLPPAEAEQNVAYLRSMVTQQNSWAQIRQSERRGAPQQRAGAPAAPGAAAAPAAPRG
ncbi:MAG: tetratricopeptide repeat protein [Phreatobacter sp.]|uniref:tetratricopeptide repeat protein n=1 Tax=Phreatobacter sp. TaxID=1966341 RepID=UPI00403732CB